MAVNIFLSNHVWTAPLNEFGIRQHVAALYDEVFRGSDVHVYPKDPTGNLLWDGLKHLPPLISGEVNVLTQGYPLVAGAIATWLKRDPGLIVHTWKVPGYTDKRVSARVNDMLLRRVINRARAVVVVNMIQKRQIEVMGVSCPVMFTPVSVDSDFWRTDTEDISDVLQHFGLTSNGYILTVGGPDRDELYAAKVAKLLGMHYVRSTYDSNTAECARLQLAHENLEGQSQILINPSHVQLRALYARAWLVCLPTLTRTNPAGLASLVEAMACSAVVAIPESIAEGYVDDGVNGLVLKENPEDFVTRLHSLNEVDLISIRQSARNVAELKFDNLTIAQQLRDQLQSDDLLE